jgi:hypothetical protein
LYSLALSLLDSDSVTTVSRQRGTVGGRRFLCGPSRMKESRRKHVLVGDEVYTFTDDSVQMLLLVLKTL